MRYEILSWKNFSSMVGRFVFLWWFLEVVFIRLRTKKKVIKKNGDFFSLFFWE